MIAALGLDGIRAANFGDWSLDGDIFLQYVQKISLPELRPGDIVIMDNLRVHKVKGVEESIESVGAKVVYLPPYSPDLSPIELLWSKVKTVLRQKAARSFEQLKQAMHDAFRSVALEDIYGWFEHCGYSIS